MKLSKLKSCTVILQGFQPLNLLMTLFLTQIEFPQEWIYVKTARSNSPIFYGFFLQHMQSSTESHKEV